MVFYGERRNHPLGLIFVITTRRLHRKGCTWYLANIFATRASEVILEDVLVERDFLDVFLDELPGLPS